MLMPMSWLEVKRVLLKIWKKDDMDRKLDRQATSLKKKSIVSSIVGSIKRRMSSFDKSVTSRISETSSNGGIDRSRRESTSDLGLGLGSTVEEQHLKLSLVANYDQSSANDIQISTSDDLPLEYERKETELSTLAELENEKEADYKEETKEDEEKEETKEDEETLTSNNSPKEDEEDDVFTEREDYGLHPGKVSSSRPHLALSYKDMMSSRGPSFDPFALDMISKSPPKFHNESNIAVGSSNFKKDSSSDEAKPSQRRDVERRSTNKASSLQKAKQMIDEVKGGGMASVLASRTDSKYDELTPNDLKALLEHSAVFVPSNLLDKLFDDIDDDKSGTISGIEMRSYLERSEKMSRWARRCHIIQQVVRDWGFYANWVWIVSCFLFLIAIWLGREGSVSVATINLLRGLGNIGWFVGGVFCMPSAVRGVYIYIDYSYELYHALGRLSYLFDENEGSGLDMLELYDAMLENGVVLPFDVYRMLFNKADIDKDGLLQASEIEHCIKTYKTKVKGWKRHRRAIKASFTSSSVFNAWLLTGQGIMWICVSFAAPEDFRKTLKFGFAGILMLLYISSTEVIKKFLNIWRKEFHLERSKTKMKRGIILKARQQNVPAAEEYMNGR